MNGRRLSRVPAACGVLSVIADGGAESASTVTRRLGRGVVLARDCFVRTHASAEGGGGAGRLGCSLCLASTRCRFSPCCGCISSTSLAVASACTRRCKEPPVPAQCLSKAALVPALKPQAHWNGTTNSRAAASLCEPSTRGCQPAALRVAASGRGDHTVAEPATGRSPPQACPASCSSCRPAARHASFGHSLRLEQRVYGSQGEGRGEWS
jgi:hypothetical protein